MNHFSWVNALKLPLSLCLALWVAGCANLGAINPPIEKAADLVTEPPVLAATPSPNLTPPVTTANVTKADTSKANAIVSPAPIQPR
jgi:hypothetical protein